MDIFDEKSVKPMLIARQSEPFNSIDYIFELKFDGIRCIAYSDKDSVDFRNKKNISLNPLFPELQDLYKQVKDKCILDGELIVLSNGKPEFYEIQRRAIMRDPFKIKLAAGKLPVTFVVYDILYYKNTQITSYPLMERKHILGKIIEENERIAISRYIAEKGLDLFDVVVNQELEGVVAKLSNSRYYFDKKSKDWIKFKNLLDDDYVVGGYAFTKDGMNSLFLGQYRGNQLIYKGNVSLGVGGQNFKKILKQPKLNTSPFSNINANTKVYWLEPTLVITVSYMYKTSSGALRQPVFKGYRDDKLPEECIDSDYT